MRHFTVETVVSLPIFIMTTFIDAFIDTATLKEKREEIECFYQEQTEHLSFVNNEGYTLTAVKLIVNNPRDFLVIIPGRGEIGHKFAEFFYTLSLLKIGAVVIFARGQAQSTRILEDRQKCHLHKFEDLTSDVTFVLNAMNIHNYKLLAFSLGGLVSLDIIKNGTNKPQRAALISPYLWPYFKLPKFILTVFIMIFGTLSFTQNLYTPHGKEYKPLEFDNNHHSHDKERFTYYHEYFKNHPELTIGGPTYRFVREAMRKQLEMLHDSFEFTLPIYTQSSENDRVVDTKTCQNFFLDHQKDKVPPQFEIIKGAFHDVINESDEYRIEPLAKALNFLFTE